jgi:hypothetical protein
VKLLERSDTSLSRLCAEYSSQYVLCFVFRIISCKNVKRESLNVHFNLSYLSSMYNFMPKTTDGDFSVVYGLNRRASCLVFFNPSLFSCKKRKEIDFVTQSEIHHESTHADTYTRYPVSVLMVSLIDLGIGYVLARYCDVTAITNSQSMPKACDQYMDVFHMSSCPLVRIGLLLLLCCSVLSVRRIHVYA